MDEGNVMYCERCDEKVCIRKRDTKRMLEVHKNPYLLSCGCSSVPISNFPEVDTGYWVEKREIKRSG